MTEPAAEIPQSTGIQLVSSEDSLTFDRTSNLFRTKSVPIPHIGTAELVGVRPGIREGYDEQRYGLAITNDSLSEEKARTLHDNGFYQFDLSIREVPEELVNVPLTCELVFPEKDITLESQISHVGASIGRGPYEWTGSFADWGKSNDDSSRDYPIFVKPDPSLLSKLRFSFKSQL